jgi:hypothetical protein
MDKPKPIRGRRRRVASDLKKFPVVSSEAESVNLVTAHPRSRDIAATMTTIWRPHWLIEHIEPVKEEVPDDDVPDVKVEPPDDDGINAEDEKTHLEGKGAKRKRAPRTKRAMRARGEEALEVQGVRCLSARSSAL